jgi:aminopeptidase N
MFNNNQPMYKIFLLFFLSFAWSSNASESHCSHQCSQHKTNFTYNTYQQVSVKLSDRYNVFYEKISLDINPKVRYIKGSIEYKIKVISRDLDSLIFNLTDSLLVTKLESSKLKSYTHSKNEIIIVLNTNISKDSNILLTIEYEGMPRASAGSIFVNRFQSNNIPVIWTLSEPYGAEEWMPIGNNLDDKIDSMDVFISCPERYQAVSNGLLIDVVSQNPFKRYHWSHRYPISAYLIAIAVSEYSVFIDTIKLSRSKMPIYHYAYPFDSTNIISLSVRIKDFLHLFDSLLSPYPFDKEKYGHLQFGWGGGMEHQTMSYMGSYDFGIQAHELAHQWFGNLITCGSWTDIWLNESFATYMSYLAHEILAPEYKLIFLKGEHTGPIREPHGSVFCKDTTNFGSIFNGNLSYAKGAMVLHQLRWLLGDSLFFGSIKSYLNDESLKYRFARTVDLIKHFDKVTGKSYQSYFDEWIYGSGYPNYFFVVDKDHNKITIKQTTTDSSVLFYKMKIPISMYRNGEKIEKVFDFQYEGQVFDVNDLDKMDSIEVDPDYKIIGVKRLLYDYSSIQMTSTLAEDYINVQSIDNDEIIDMLYVCDIEGKRILTNSFAEKVKIIPVSILPIGMYIVTVQTNKGWHSLKFIKH